MRTSLVDAGRYFVSFLFRTFLAQQFPLIAFDPLPVSVRANSPLIAITTGAAFMLAALYPAVRPQVVYDSNVTHLLTRSRLGDI